MMNSKYKYLIKNVGILTISNFSSKILVFLLVPLYTSILTTEQYGAYDLAVSTVQLLIPILTLDIVDAVMRFALDKESDKGMIAFVGLKYCLLSIGVATVVLLFFTRSHFFAGFKGFELLILFYYISSVFYQYLIQLARGLEKTEYQGFAGVIATISMILLNVLFLVFWDWELEGFFLANTIALIVPSVYIFVRIKVWKLLGVRKKDKNLEKNMLSYSMPLVPSMISWWINSTSDRYIVTWICGLGANGLLSVAYKIPTIINTVQGIFIQAWQISAIKEYEEDSDNTFYDSSFGYLNFMMCMACSLLILLSKLLAHILFSNDFYQAWQYVPFLLVSSVFNAASGFVGPILSAVKDTKSLSLSTIYGAVINIVLNIILVYFIGVSGAAIATAISSFVIFIVRKQALTNIMRLKIEKSVWFVWILLCLQAFLMVYVNGFIFQICIFMIVGYIFKMQLFTLIRKII